MVISALIITYGRPLWLERCVNSLLAAARSCEEIRLEITIAVNGIDQESTRMSQSLVRDHPGRVRWIGVIEPALSPAAARNWALKELSSPWILFIDDDAYVDSDYFRRFVHVSRCFENASAIGGPNLTPVDSSCFQYVVGAVMQSRLATFTSYTRYRKTGSPRDCDEGALILCNLFVRREALGDSPFPAAFYCAEENWLIQTMTSRGLQVIHDPELCVWHERRGELRSFAKQVFKYGFGRGQNIRKRPSTTRVAHLVPSLCLVLGIASIVRAVVSFHFSPLFLALVAVYTLLCLIAAGRQTCDRADWLRIAILFPIVHVYYGAGVLAGLLSFGL